MNTHFHIAGIKPSFYVPLTTSDTFDRPAKLCVYWHSKYLNLPYNFEKKENVTDICRINVKPSEHELTIREYKKYSFLANIKSDRFDSWYEKIKDVSNSIILAFHDIPKDLWLNVEHFDGENWTSIDLKDSIFKDPLNNYEKYIEYFEKRIITRNHSSDSYIN